MWPLSACFEFRCSYSISCYNFPVQPLEGSRHMSLLRPLRRYWGLFHMTAPRPHPLLPHLPVTPRGITSPSSSPSALLSVRDTECGGPRSRSADPSVTERERPMAPVCYFKPPVGHHPQLVRPLAAGITR